MLGPGSVSAALTSRTNDAWSLPIRHNPKFQLRNRGRDHGNPAANIRGL